MSVDDVDAVTLRGISSMAMRKVLSAMGRSWTARSGSRVDIESVGGVVAAGRVANGEAFDFTVLATDALARLAERGHVVAKTVTPLARSSSAVAIAAGAKPPDISTEFALKNAFLDARSIGYSTGPSGDQLLRLFERWGIASVLASRIVQASPGVPVAALVARGEVEIGFQQLSELVDVPGVDVVGTLPAHVQPPTAFAGAVCTAARHPAAARELLAFFASPAGDEARRSNGMEPF